MSDDTCQCHDGYAPTGPGSCGIVDQHAGGSGRGGGSGIGGGSGSGGSGSGSGSGRGRIDLIDCALRVVGAGAGWVSCIGSTPTGIGPAVTCFAASMASASAVKTCTGN